MSVGIAVSFFLGDCCGVEGDCANMDAHFFFSIWENEGFGWYRKCFPLVIGDGACLSPRRSCLVKDLTRFV